MSAFQFGAWYISIPKIESLRSNFPMKVIFDVIGVFLAFYASIDKLQKYIVPFQSQNLTDFGLIPQNI